MIGVVIVTQGNMGKEFLEILRTNFSCLPAANINALSLGFDDKAIKEREECHVATIRAAIRGASRGDGVVLVTDYHGFESTRLALRASGEESGIQIKVITDANLPMIVKLACERVRLPLNELSEAAQRAAQKYIVVASKIPQCG